MAREKSFWGYTRLHGALKNLGLELGRSTIARILKNRRIEPAPLRGKTMSWKTFLRARGARSGGGLFSVEVLTAGGFVRYLVLFVIELKTRRVHVAGITCQADEVDGWIARNLTDAIAGLCRGSRY